MVYGCGSRRRPLPLRSPDWRKRHQHNNAQKRSEKKKCTNGKRGPQSVLARVVYLYYFERKYAIPPCLLVLWGKVYMRTVFLHSFFYFLPPSSSSSSFFLKSKTQNVRMKPTGICGCFSAPNEVNLYNRLYYVSMCALLPLPSHVLRAISVTRENDVQSIT